jgi:hypothetical protein
MGWEVWQTPRRTVVRQTASTVVGKQFGKHRDVANRSRDVLRGCSWLRAEHSSPQTPAAAKVPADPPAPAAARVQPHVRVLSAGWPGYPCARGPEASLRSDGFSGHASAELAPGQRHGCSSIPVRLRCAAFSIPSLVADTSVLERRGPEMIRSTSKSGEHPSHSAGTPVDSGAPMYILPPAIR